MHVRRLYFDLLRDGQKTVEIRLNDEKRQGVKEGDKILFVCNDIPSERVILTVSSILRRKTFLELLDAVPEHTLGGIIREEQLSKLNAFYSPKEEAFLGTVAFFLEK